VGTVVTKQGFLKNADNTSEVHFRKAEGKAARLTGEVTPIVVFVAILPYSQYIYAEGMESTKEMQWIEVNLMVSGTAPSWRNSAWWSHFYCLIKCCFTFSQSSQTIPQSLITN
jgi:hypothetical protein